MNRRGVFCIGMGPGRRLVEAKCLLCTNVVKSAKAFAFAECCIEIDFGAGKLGHLCESEAVRCFFTSKFRTVRIELGGRNALEEEEVFRSSRIIRREAVGIGRFIERQDPARENHNVAVVSRKRVGSICESGAAFNYKFGIVGAGKRSARRKQAAVD